MTLPYGVGMPQLTRPAALALVVAAALLLSGCIGEPPVVLPSPQSSTAPVFATDEEALAAAEEAYGRYLAASDAINAKDGKDPQTIAPFVHHEYLPELLDEFESFRANRTYVKGHVLFDSIRLQQYSDDLSGPAQIAVYLCLDVTNARLMSYENKDITPTRNDRLPLEVVFETEGREQQLLVKSGELWTGADFCEE